MVRARWGVAVALMAIGGLSVPAAAVATGGLTLSISMPRIEGNPMTFTAQGIAGPAIDGDSSDFLYGGLISQKRACPAEGSYYGNELPNQVAPTLNAFPIGPFNVSQRVTPTGVDAQDLLTGKWRECAYLQDRSSNAVIATGQEDFTVRNAHVSARILSGPRHIHFTFDILGRPLATVTFVVRASAEVAFRTLQIGVEKPGQRRACTGDMSTATAGESNMYRVRTGAARRYRVRTDLIFPAGRAPFGRRVRVCTVVSYNSPADTGQHLETAAISTLTIRR
jgi:hypothetical protein